MDDESKSVSPIEQQITSINGVIERLYKILEPVLLLDTPKNLQDEPEMTSLRRDLSIILLKLNTLRDRIEL